MPNAAWLAFNDEDETSSGASGLESVGGRAVENDHQDEIQVLGCEHTLYMPTDSQSGQQTGAPISEGLTILKMFDVTSPLLMQAMKEGKLFEEVVLSYVRTEPSGEENVYFLQTMEDVVITDIQQYMPNCLDLSNENYTHMEKVTLKYKKLTWEHDAAGTAGVFNTGIFSSSE